MKSLRGLKFFVNLRVFVSLWRAIFYVPNFAAVYLAARAT